MEISKDLPSHSATFRSCLRRVQRIRWAAGAPPRIPEEGAATILAWVREGPQGYGPERANWTCAELAANLDRAHGIKVREAAMRAFCRRRGVRPYRPT